MIMIVYKSLYALGIYYEEMKLLETSWTAESSKLEISEAKNEFLEILGAIEQYKPGFILADTCKFNLQMDSEFQNWIVMHFISEIIELKVTKYAILVTSDTFKVVSEELMAGFPDEGFEIQYFTSREQAMNWMGVK
jgi:hypothetical protein